MNLHYLLLEVRIRDNVKMHNYLQLSIILHGGEFNPCIIMEHKTILVGHKIFEIQGSYHIYILFYLKKLEKNKNKIQSLKVATNSH